MGNKCYAIFCGDYIPKNIFEKIYYKLWLMCGVSPSGLLQYCQYKSEKIASYFIQEYEKGLKEYEEDSNKLFEIKDIK